MKLTQVITRASQIVETHLDNEIVLMNFETNKFYNFSGTGKRVWELMEDGKTLSSVVDAISSEYGIDKEKCLTDITPMCEKLIENQLITLSD